MNDNNYDSQDIDNTKVISDSVDNNKKNEFVEKIYVKRNDSLSISQSKISNSKNISYCKIDQMYVHNYNIILKMCQEKVVLMIKIMIMSMI